MNHYPFFYLFPNFIVPYSFQMIPYGFFSIFRFFFLFYDCFKDEKWSAVILTSNHLYIQKYFFNDNHPFYSFYLYISTLYMHYN